MKLLQHSYNKLLDFLFGPLIIDVDIQADAIRALPASGWEGPITLMENARVVGWHEYREGGILKGKWRKRQT